VSQDGREISISLQDLVAFVVRGLLYAAIVAGTVGALMYAYEQRKPPVFRAESTLLVARTTAGFGQFNLSPVTAPPIEMSAYRAAAQTDRVLTDALILMGVETPTVADIQRLRGRTGSFIAGEGRDSSLLGVEARGETRDIAVARADALAEALVAWDRRRATESLTRVIGTLEQQINALGEQIRTMQSGETGEQTQIDGLIRLRADQQQQLGYARALVASAEGLLSVLQPAGTTPRQIAPRPAMTAAVAMLLAVIATYAFLLLKSAFNTRLRSAEDMIEISGLPLLAEFAHASGRKHEWRQQEAANYLRTNVLFATADAHPKVVMVASAGEHEGKTTVACLLAEGLARNGYRTLLVDADLRSPSIGQRYGIADHDGSVTTTRDWMTSTSSRPRNVLRVALDASSELFVVPQFGAVPDASEALARGFPMALDQWNGYDVIIVDTAPLLAVADALAIAPRCTGTVLVVDAQRTTRNDLIAAKGLLERVGVTVLGLVANRVRGSSRSGAYGGAYGSAYGSAAPAPARAKAKARPRPRSADAMARSRD
jgi:capsular exopolysaccharide synthesis family protein